MNGSVTYEGAILSGNININAGGDPVLDDITITENGHYTPPAGVDGYDDITVNVQETPPVLDDITITENGTYTPPSGVDGYDEITVNVPDVPASILPLNIVSNGTYEAPEGLDGYNPISVSVQVPEDETLHIYTNGTYRPSSPDKRFNVVYAEVPDFVKPPMYIPYVESAIAINMTEDTIQQIYASGMDIGASLNGQINLSGSNYTKLRFDISLGESYDSMNNQNLRPLIIGVSGNKYTSPTYVAAENVNNYFKAYKLYDVNNVSSRVVDYVDLTNVTGDIYFFLTATGWNYTINSITLE